MLMLRMGILYILYKEGDKGGTKSKIHSLQMCMRLILVLVLVLVLVQILGLLVFLLGGKIQKP
jgi:hypothetical protein